MTPVDRLKFKEVAEEVFNLFPGKPHEVSLEVAQGMIFSACEYSESLGFQPHKDARKIAIAHRRMGWDNTY